MLRRRSNASSRAESCHQRSFRSGKSECETVLVSMRDGVRLATDLYLPPVRPAPVVAMRTPYGRSVDGNVGAFFSFARRGYVVVAQDCRGTGASEPDSWDYYMYESEDGYDLIEWIIKQDWFCRVHRFLRWLVRRAAQWCMATHPAMSTIVPQVSGLGIAFNTAHLYMFQNAYARSVARVKTRLQSLSTTWNACSRQRRWREGISMSLCTSPSPKHCSRGLQSCKSCRHRSQSVGCGSAIVR